MNVIPFLKEQLNIKNGNGSGNDKGYLFLIFLSQNEGGNIWNGKRTEQGRDKYFIRGWFKYFIWG